MYRDELLQQTTFNVPDFFARVLLYTTCVDNNEGRPYTEQVAGSFIEKVVKESWVETKWDATTQAIKIIPSEERRLFDEVNVLSELRFSLMTNQVSCADTGWLGVDESVLFPSRKSIDFGSPTTKAMLWSKLDQYTKLVHELTDCLMAQQRSTAGRTTMWPIFPDERMQDIRQRLMNLSNEILFLGLFPERLNEG